MHRYHKDMTLTDTLLLFGYTHKESKGNSNGREIYNSNGVCVGVSTAEETWEWLDTTGKIKS